MKQEIKKIREVLKSNHCDGYIIPTSDFHGSEYINDYFQFRRYASGFTGSAGVLFVTQETADLWTDGRYFLQASKELDGSGITLQKSSLPGVPTLTEYIKSTIKSGQTIAFDGNIMPLSQGNDIAKAINEAGAKLRTDFDLASLVWESRPALHGDTVFSIPASTYGEEFSQKVSRIRQQLRSLGASHIIVCSLEENAWLFNLRGSDIDGTPVFFSYSLISNDHVILYGFNDAFVAISLPEEVTLKPYMQDNRLTIMEDLSKLSGDSSVLIDPETCSYSMFNILDSKCNVLTAKSPLAYFKSKKNDAEIASTKSAHIDDGLAVTKFIYYLKTQVSSQNLTEISAADYLLSLRQKSSDFLGVSFDTISGYGSNGAIIHYSATEESNAEIKPEGFLLVDSGGQYLRGTTDITRTISLGPLSDKMKKCYTSVLKGHIQLAISKFTKDTPGTDLDEIARRPIRAIGYDYNHGTGHGVGHILCVHEGPNVINMRKKYSDIVEGTITTDEPGIYIEGEFGVRLENELLCKKFDDSGTLCFEPLTLCPFDRNAIIKDMLTDEELSYLNNYHKKVYNTLAPLLDQDEREFLYNETAAL